MRTVGSNPTLSVPPLQFDWSMTPTLAKIGLCEIAFAAMLGWALIVQREKPEWMVRAGVIAPRRILQCHLDQIMMGLILIAVGLAVESLPTWIAVPLVFGAIMNPLLFLPEAFSKTVGDRLWFKALGLLSIVAMSGGMVAVAVFAL